MLSIYGITKVYWDFDPEHYKIELNFETEVEIEGVKRHLAFSLRPPLFVKERMTYNPILGRHERVKAPNIAQSMRFFKDYLKIKLLGVHAGFNPIEKEFLAEVMVSIKGQPTRIGDALTDAIKTGQLSLPSASPNEKVIDAQ